MRWLPNKKWLQETSNVRYVTTLHLWPRINTSVSQSIVLWPHANPFAKATLFCGHWIMTSGHRTTFVATETCSGRSQNVPFLVMQYYVVWKNNLVCSHHNSRSCCRNAMLSCHHARIMRSRTQQYVDRKLYCVLAKQCCVPTVQIALPRNCIG